jgi:hypothetical protein
VTLRNEFNLNDHTCLNLLKLVKGAGVGISALV